MKEVVIKKTNRCDTRTLAPGTVVSEQDVRTDTEYHIDAVKKLGYAITDELKKQFDKHDFTKMDNIPWFTNALNKGFDSKEFKDWYKMHVNTERHHLLKSVPDDVNLIDVLEMLCDCCSAGMARTGNVFDVEVPPEILVKAVENTVKMIIKSIKVED